MNHSRRLLALLLLTLSTSAASDTAVLPDTAPGTVPFIEDVDFLTIRALLEEYETSIHSYSLRYTTQTEYTPAALSAMRRSGSTPPETRPKHSEFVVDGDKVWSKNSFVNAGKLGSEVLVHDGTRTLQIMLDDAGRPTGAGESLSSKHIAVEAASPIRVAGLACGPHIKARYTFLDSSSVRLVETTLSRGRKTHVIEGCSGPVRNTTQRLHLDPDHDFLPSRIETLSPSGDRLFVVNVSRFAPISTDEGSRPAWFPVEYEQELYGRYTPGEADIVFKVKVESFEINPTISADQFDVTVPRDVPVANAETKAVRIVSTPERRAAMAKESAEKARQVLELALNSAQVTDPVMHAGVRSTYGWLSLLTLTSGAMLIALGAILWYRRCH